MQTKPPLGLTPRPRSTEQTYQHGCWHVAVQLPVFGLFYRVSNVHPLAQQGKIHEMANHHIPIKGDIDKL